jgi:acylphosphatase
VPESQAILHAIIHGRVQGVSFRFYTQQQAEQLGITGWVRNLPDTTVETTAVGPKAALEVLLKWLHRGPSGARVTRVDVDWLDTPGTPTTYTAFEIRHD